MKAQPIRTYGWRPDKPGLEEWHRPTSFGLVSAVRSPKVSLSAAMTPCYDQGNIGSCTGNAIAGAIEYCRAKENYAPFRPSRLFIYYNERVIERTVRVDAGAEIRDGITTIKIMGACSETDWPYIEKKFAAKPTARAYVDAKKDLIHTAAPVRQDLDDICDALAEGWPLVFGFTVYESFESKAVAQTGMVPMPTQQERVLGGHAVLLAGYDDEQRLFEVRNSWGTTWGKNGYCWMPYDYLLSPDLASDFWQINATSG